MAGGARCNLGKIHLCQVLCVNNDQEIKRRAGLSEVDEATIRAQAGWRGRNQIDTTPKSFLQIAGMSRQLVGPTAAKFVAPLFPLRFLLPGAVSQTHGLRGEACERLHADVMEGRRSLGLKDRPIS